MHIAAPWVTCFVFPSLPVGSVLSLCQVVGLGGVLGFPHSPVGFLWRACWSDLQKCCLNKRGIFASLRNPSFVVLGGLEPPLTEPKTVVLPLHHGTIAVQKYMFLLGKTNFSAFFYSKKAKVVYFYLNS